jgi:hypothetical protein
MKTTRLFRSAIWPALLSAVVAPGLGQIANRDYKKGIFLLATSLGSFLWFSKVVTDQLSLILPGTPDEWRLNPVALKEAVFKIVNQNPSMFLVFQILMVVVWMFGVVDAYLTARRPNTLKDDTTDHDPSDDNPTDEDTHFIR